MKKLIILLLLAAFSTAIVWVALIPIWQSPDEQAHFAQVQDLAELGYKPKKQDTSYEILITEQALGTERDYRGNNKYVFNPSYRYGFSSSQTGPLEKYISNLPASSRTVLVKKEATFNPPLYYSLAVIPYNLFYDSSIFTRVTAVRFLSLVIFLAMITFSYRIGRLIFSNKIFALSLASFVAFNPMLVSVSTGVLPDPFTNLFFTMIIYFGLLIIKSGLKLKYLVFSCFILILGHLTRQQFLVAALILAAPIFYVLVINFIHQNEKRRHLKLLTIALILSVVTLNVTNILGKLSLPEIGRPDISLLLSKSFIEYTVWLVKKTVAETLPWYWGVYKWLSLTLPPFVYQVINRLIMVSFAGLAFWIFTITVRKSIKLPDKFILFFVYSSAIYYLIFLVGDFYFKQRFSYSFGIQGRYFFPLIVAHLSILFWGLLWVFKIILKQFNNYAVLGLVILVLIFNDFTLVYLASSYYDTTSIQSFITQASQYKAPIFKGNNILFLIVLSFIFQALFLFEFFNRIKTLNLKPNEEEV